MTYYSEGESFRKSVGILLLALMAAAIAFVVIGFTAWTIFGDKPTFCPDNGVVYEGCPQSPN